MVNMSYSLAFNYLHRYAETEVGITVPVELHHKSRDVKLDAKLDTGASFCIFPRQYGVALGLNIESGLEELIDTATGDFKAYGHEVTLSALGVSLEVVVYFSKYDTLKRSVLGRRGWIERLRLGIVDYDRHLYVSRYNDLL
jgi:hypothetical protein